MALGKKTRFEVFKRDGFVCQYCGNHPPAVILEIDHVKPRAKGGTDDIDNLLTSCFDCNRGKGARELTTAPQSIEEKAAILAEKERQIDAYNDLLRRKRERENDTIDLVEMVFRREINHCFTETFRESIRKNFLPRLDYEQLAGAMKKALAKDLDAQNTVKYFCGICWNIIREQGRG